MNIRDRLEKVIASADALGRDKTLAALKSIQDEALKTLALAEEAFDGEQGDVYEGSRVVGYDIGSSFAPALIIRKGRGPGLILPVSVEKTAGGKQRVVFAPLMQGPTFVPVKKDSATAARESARITAQAPDVAEAAAPANPFWVEPSDAGAAYRKTIADAAKPENRPSMTRGPHGTVSITVPSEKTKAAVKAKARAALETARAGKKLDRWGDPL